MDGNKDEALKCLQIGKSAIESGDRNRAQKFLSKARRLDPSIEIDDLLAKIPEPPDESTLKSPSSVETPSGPRKRAPSSSTPAAYTSEQVSIVREIKRKKDYYDILGIERSCVVEDVRKAYRKLSLKVHPDKNQAPGAEEAFKKVSKAFQCLSDEGNRRRYDVSGDDEPVVERRGQGMQGFNGCYDQEFDADEIFRNFFFGGMHPAATTQFRGFGFGQGMGGRGAADQGSQGIAVRLIQILPVLVILLLNFIPSPDPIYSLSKSYPYDYRFTTEKGVDYYVKAPDFEQKYPPNSLERVSLENRVQRDYYSIMSHNCRVEMQQFNWGYRRETPNCDKLRRLQSVAS